jgi:hypothetical protein
VSSIDDFIKNIQQGFQNLINPSGGQASSSPTFVKSSSPVAANLQGLESTYLETDPFARFFANAIDIIRGSSLPDGSHLGDDVKLVGFDGVDFGNYMYKLGGWFNKATVDLPKALSDLATAQNSLTTALNEVATLGGAVLPDGTKLIPDNITWPGADASTLIAKVTNWYKNSQLYISLQSTYAALQSSFGSAEQELSALAYIQLPDSTYLLGPSNIVLPQVDATGLLNKVKQWYTNSGLYASLSGSWNSVMGYTLPDKTTLQGNMTLGSTGIDFTTLTNKLASWFNKATVDLPKALSDLATAQNSLTTALNTMQLIGQAKLPDGTKLIPDNITLSGDTSTLITKVTDWYNNTQLYKSLQSTYAALQTSFNNEKQELDALAHVQLPDSTYLLGPSNIVLPQVDATGLLNKVKQWFNQSSLYTSLSGSWNTVMGYTLPDNSKLQANITLGSTGIDFSAFTKKLASWYNGLSALNVVLAYNLPDKSTFTSNIKWGSIDFSPLTTKLSSWYQGFNAFASTAATKLSGALANINLSSLLNNSAGALDLSGFISRLTNQFNTLLDTYVIAPAENFATELAVEILKLIFRIQALQVRMVVQGLYGIDSIVGGVYWTLDKNTYQNKMSDMLALFNSLSDVFLPGIGFRFVTNTLPSNAGQLSGDWSYYATLSMHYYALQFWSECDTSPHYVYCYFRSLYNLRPKLTLLVPECYGKQTGANWDSFVESALGVSLDRLLYDLIGLGQGGIQWAGVQFTHNTSTIRSMSLPNSPSWLGGRDNFFNNWFGQLKLNLLDLTKTWTARVPSGSDGTQTSYIPALPPAPGQPATSGKTVTSTGGTTTTTGGGCPALLVYDGKFRDEGILNIHNVAAPFEDMVVRHHINSGLKTVKGKYMVKLREVKDPERGGHSFITEVALVGSVDGQQFNFPLASAEHSRLGNVTGESVVETQDGEELLLKFDANPYIKPREFTFVLKGHNPKTVTTGAG